MPDIDHRVRWNMAEAVTNLPNWFSLNKLAEGFSEIEKDPRSRVAEVRIHPEDVESFLSAVAVGADIPVKHDEVIVGQIWQAIILKDEAIPRTRLKLVSDKMGGLLSPTEVWV